MRDEIFCQNNQKLSLIKEWPNSPDFDDLALGINWRQNQIKIFGKTYDEPRLTAWFGPAYKYSSIRWESRPFPPQLSKLLHDVSVACAFPFNAVLCNFYRDGNDAMGWHADNEPEINTSCIASLSLGASRTMFFKSRHNEEKITIELHNKTLLVIENMQENWLHAIPKRKKITEARINLTFRQILVQ